MKKRPLTESNSLHDRSPRKKIKTQGAYLNILKVVYNKPTLAQLIKIQRQKLGLNMKVRKAKQSPLALTSTSVQNGNPASRSLRMRLCLRAVSFNLIILFSAGIQVCNTGLKAHIKGVCHRCLVCKDNQWGCFTL